MPRRVHLFAIAAFLLSCGADMSLPPDHQMVTAADAGPGAPFTEIECPSDDAEVTAEDIRRVAAVCLANDDAILGSSPNFTNGINVSNATTNGDAISAIGNGTGRGITSTGGSSNGSGGQFVGGATNGIGLGATGSGTGFGAQIQGGSNGSGLNVSAGGGNNHGIDAYSTGTGHAIRCQNGNIQLNGTSPLSSVDPGQHVFSSAHYSKAWGRILLDGAGSYSVEDGLNIDSVTVTSTYVEVNWARIFFNNKYAPNVTGEGSATSSITGHVNYAAQTTAKTRIFFFEHVGGTSAVNPATTSFRFTIDVKGRD
jgi:hypothetical protein